MKSCDLIVTKNGEKLKVSPKSINGKKLRFKCKQSKG